MILNQKTDLLFQELCGVTAPQDAAILPPNAGLPPGISPNSVIDEQTGKLPAVGSTVDVETATFTNAIGSAMLSSVWQDPDFDASERAFYYVRVLEIPRPRWSTYDAVYFGLELPEEIPRVIQDRAYTSPIWYTP